MNRSSAPSLFSSHLSSLDSHITQTTCAHSSCFAQRRLFFGVLQFRLVAVSAFMFAFCASVLQAQSPFSSSKQSVVLSNAQSGVSEAWLGLMAPSGLSSSYRLIFPTSAPTTNQLLTVSSISGSDYTLGWTNGSNVTGTGTATQVAFWSGASTLSSSSSLYWDNTNNRLGVGTSSPTAKIHSVVTNANSSITSLNSANRAVLCENTTNSGAVGIQFVAKNSGGTARTVNVGIDPGRLGTNTAFGIVPDGISDGGLLIDIVNGNMLIGSTVSGSSIVNKLSINGNLSVGTGYREITAPTDGAIIQGDVGIGTSSPANRLTVSNGTTTGNYTTSGWTHSSDARLKTNIRPITNALSIVEKLQGVRFQWKNSSDQSDQIGFIAQQVEPYLPEVVSTDSKGMKSMAYANLSALHNEAIKELDDKLKQIEGSTSSLSHASSTPISRKEFIRFSQDEHLKDLNQIDDKRLLVVVAPGQSVQIDLNLHLLSDVPLDLSLEGSEHIESDVFLEATDNAGLLKNAWMTIGTPTSVGAEKTEHQNVLLHCSGVVHNNSQFESSIRFRLSQTQGDREIIIKKNSYLGVKVVEDRP